MANAMSFRKMIPTSGLRAQGDPMNKLRHHRFLLITHPRRNPYKNGKHFITNREWGYRSHSHPQKQRPQGIRSSPHRKGKRAAVARNGQRIP